MKEDWIEVWLWAGVLLGGYGVWEEDRRTRLRWYLLAVYALVGIYGIITW